MTPLPGLPSHYCKPGHQTTLPFPRTTLSRPTDNGATTATSNPAATAPHQSCHANAEQLAAATSNNAEPNTTTDDAAATEGPRSEGHGSQRVQNKATKHVYKQRNKRGNYQTCPPPQEQQGPGWGILYVPQEAPLTRGDTDTQCTCCAHARRERFTEMLGCHLHRDEDTQADTTNAHYTPEAAAAQCPAATARGPATTWNPRHPQIHNYTKQAKQHQTTTDHEAAETTAAQTQPPIKMHQSRNGPHYQRPGTPPCTNSNDPYSCNNPEAHHPWEDPLMQEWSDTQPDLFEATRRTALRQHDERDDPTNSRVLGTDSPPTPYNGPQPTLGRPRHVRQGPKGTSSPSGSWDDGHRSPTCIGSSWWFLNPACPDDIRAIRTAPPVANRPSAAPTTPTKPLGKTTTPALASIAEYSRRGTESHHRYHTNNTPRRNRHRRKLVTRSTTELLPNPIQTQASWRHTKPSTNTHPPRPPREQHLSQRSFRGYQTIAWSATTASRGTTTTAATTPTRHSTCGTTPRRAKQQQMPTTTPPNRPPTARRAGPHQPHAEPGKHLQQDAAKPTHRRSHSRSNPTTQHQLQHRSQTPCTTVLVLYHPVFLLVELVASIIRDPLPHCSPTCTL